MSSFFCSSSSNSLDQPIGTSSPRKASSSEELVDMFDVELEEIENFHFLDDDSDASISSQGLEFPS